MNLPLKFGNLPLIYENKKTKIIYIITKGNWGGAQKYVFDLATALPKNEFDVSVILGQGEILEKRLLEKKIKIIKIPKMQRDVSVFKEFSLFFTIFKILKEEKPDIVHLNSSKASGLGALAARLSRIPKIVFTAHGWPFNEQRSWWQKTIVKFLSWLTVLLSTEVVVMSVENLRQARQFPFARKKLFFIYNGISKIDFKNKKSTRKFISDVTGAEIDKIWAVTISELHKNKGLEHMIKALSYLRKEIILFVIGEGEERQNLENLVKKLGLQKNVYLMGFVDEAPKYLKAFDLFTLTSLKEGHPYTILEAGLAGLPVLGSNIPGIKDIIDEETGVFVSPEDVGDIREQLEFLIRDKKKMAVLGHNLREKVLKEFSFEKSFSEVLKLYRD